MTLSSQRKANASYKSRQAEKGVKVVSLRLDRPTREEIREMATEADVSQGEVVKQLLAYYRS